MTTRTKKHHQPPAGKPILFHPGVEDRFAAWAEELRYDPERLRNDSVDAIRTRRGEATIEHESDKARGRQPNIFHLNISGGQVIYSDEPHALVIRGYTYEIYREPIDDFDGGGFVCEFHWHDRS